MNEAYQVLSDTELRSRYDLFMGIKQEPTFDENSLYAQLLRKRDQKLAEQMKEKPVKPFDLDEELRKLQEIREMREREQRTKRDEVNKRKQDEINQIFFKREMRTMKDTRFLSKDKYSYYHGETNRAKENEIKHINQSQQNTTQVDQFKIDRVSFFYAEQHESHNVDLIDAIMNGVFKLIAYGSCGVIAVLIYMHIAQRNKAAKVAAKVTEKI